MKKKLAILFTTLGIVMSGVLASQFVNPDGIASFADAQQNEKVLRSVTLNENTAKNYLTSLGDTADWVEQTYNNIPTGYYSDMSLKMLHCTRKVKDTAAENPTYEGLARLNSADSTHGPSYIMKTEACNDVASFTIKVDNGSVDVLVGYEPGVYVEKYSCSKDNGNGLPYTIETNGNYFRIENNSTSSSAIVRYFTINYYCKDAVDAPATQEYTINPGTEDQVKADPGHWHYNANGSAEVISAQTNTQNGFVATLGSFPKETSCVYFRFVCPTESSNKFVSDQYDITVTLKLSLGGKVLQNTDGTTYNLEPNELVTIKMPSYKTIGTSNTTVFNVKTGASNTENQVLTVTNIMIGRVATNK